mmetsp:Transcript_12323/g.38340  ORF Transcript_12323/g.38340 Transcript_12323/m.38340 type:complete len:236 (-) Transcript_12323:98-805(-)
MGEERRGGLHGDEVGARGVVSARRHHRQRRRRHRAEAGVHGREVHHELDAASGADDAARHERWEPGVEVVGDVVPVGVVALPQRGRAPGHRGVGRQRRRRLVARGFFRPLRRRRGAGLLLMLGDGRGVGRHRCQGGLLSRGRRRGRGCRRRGVGRGAARFRRARRRRTAWRRRPGSGLVKRVGCSAALIARRRIATHRDVGRDAAVARGRVRRHGEHEQNRQRRGEHARDHSHAT